MQDIRLDIDYDLSFQNGDLVIKDSVEQETKLSILVSEGHLKQYPTYGVGIQKYYNSILGQDLKNKIRNTLNEDGFIIEKLNIRNNNVEIETSK